MKKLNILFLDTITFQNSSSLGHLVKWIQGILSINDNPLGSGLSTQVKSLSVDDQISVGGEKSIYNNWSPDGLNWIN